MFSATLARFERLRGHVGIAKTKFGRAAAGRVRNPRVLTSRFAVFPDTSQAFRHRDCVRSRGPNGVPECGFRSLCFAGPSDITMHNMGRLELTPRLQT